MIGDSKQADIIGASRAKLASIWFHPQDQTQAGGVSDYRQLLRIIFLNNKQQKNDPVEEN